MPPGSASAGRPQPHFKAVGWGIISGASLLYALRLAHFEVERLEQAVLMVGVTLSAVLSTLVLPDIPETVGPMSTIRFAAAWLPGGAAAAWMTARRAARPSARLERRVDLGRGGGGGVSRCPFFRGSGSRRLARPGRRALLRRRDLHSHRLRHGPRWVVRHVVAYVRPGEPWSSGRGDVHDGLCPAPRWASQFPA